MKPRALLLTLLLAAGSRAPADDVREGPWGMLRVSVYNLEMPPTLAAQAELVDAGQWTLSLPSWAPFDALLQRLELPPLPDRAVDPDGHTRQVRVPAAWRRALEPEVRAQLYRWLGAFPGNRLHMLPYVLPEAAVIERAGLNPRMQAALRDLAFRRGQRTCLVDADLVAALANSPAERTRLMQLLHRTTALSVELLRESLANRDSVRDYWKKRNDRRVQEVLRRFERSPEVEAVDVLQLLPRGPRQILNSYPDDRSSPLAANCMWLSLNFFEPDLSARFLPDAVRGDTTERDARAELNAHYDEVTGPRQFGDVIAMWAETPRASVLLHLVVHIADDIVLTKNGLGYSTPFVLAPLADVSRRYAWIGELTVRTYRIHAP